MPAKKLDVKATATRNLAVRQTARCVPGGYFLDAESRLDEICNALLPPLMANGWPQLFVHATGLRLESIREPVDRHRCRHIDDAIAGACLTATNHLRPDRSHEHLHTSQRTNTTSSHEPQCSSETVTGDAQFALASESHLVGVTGCDINKPVQILDLARVETSRLRGRR